MDARIAGEMALRAAAHHRRVAHALESRLSVRERRLLEHCDPSVRKILLERGAADALKKYGNAIVLRCDLADQADPLEFLSDVTPSRPLPRFLKG